jgi:hypothetical protein
MEENGHESGTEEAVLHKSESRSADGAKRMGNITVKIYTIVLEALPEERISPDEEKFLAGIVANEIKIYWSSTIIPTEYGRGHDFLDGFLAVLVHQFIEISYVRDIINEVAHGGWLRLR